MQFVSLAHQHRGRGVPPAPKFPAKLLTEREK
jgi:hypothetical protein